MKKQHKIKAPFCYFGGKSAVADLVWELIGNDVKRYFEPFAGSLAVLLARKRKPNKLYNEINKTESRWIKTFPLNTR